MVLRNMREKKGVTCYWFGQKPSNAQLNNRVQGPPFIQRPEKKMIEGISGYNCQLMN